MKRPDPSFSLGGFTNIIGVVTFATVGTPRETKAIIANIILYRSNTSLKTSLTLHQIDETCRHLNGVS